MKEKNNTLGIFEGLSLIKNQWLSFCFAIFLSFIILSLDFILTISIPKILDDLSFIIDDGNLFNIPRLSIILLILIILRPAIGWLINYLQIRILVGILRNLEDDVYSKSNKIYIYNKNYSSENSANLLITHGRYYLDNYLIPLIRAITDVGSIIVICFGLFLKYPIPLLFFVFSITVFLSVYQFITKKLLRKNGEILVNSYEDIIKLSANGFAEEQGAKTINEVLDVKKSSSLVIGSISQGLKYVIEFCFMFSFGIAALYIIIISPSSFAAFISTFAYAAVRMLPSFSTVLAFYQGKTFAEFAINELLKHMKNSFDAK